MSATVIDLPPPAVMAAYHAMNRAIQRWWSERTEDAKAEMESLRSIYIEACRNAQWPD